MPFCYSAPHAYNLQNFFFFSVLCAIFLVSPANSAAIFNVFEFMMYAVEDKYKLQVVYYIGLLYVYLSFPCGIPSVLSLVSFTARYQGLVPSPVAAWADYLAPVPDTMCQQAPRKRCHELHLFASLVVLLQKPAHPVMARKTGCILLQCMVTCHLQNCGRVYEGAQRTTSAWLLRLLLLFIKPYSTKPSSRCMPPYDED